MDKFKIQQIEDDLKKVLKRYKGRSYNQELDGKIQRRMIEIYKKHNLSVIISKSLFALQLIEIRKKHKYEIPEEEKQRLLKFQEKIKKVSEN